MKIFKKSLSLAVALAMVLSLVSFGAFAAEPTFEATFTFKNEAGAVITSAAPGQTIYADVYVPANEYANMAISFQPELAEVAKENITVHYANVNPALVHKTNKTIQLIWTGYIEIEETPLATITLTVPKDATIADDVLVFSEKLFALTTYIDDEVKMVRGTVIPGTINIAGGETPDGNEEEPTEEPVADKSVADKPVVDKPIADKPVADKPATETPAISFEDVTTDHWAAKHIEAMKNLGIVSGKTETTFEPEAKITRAEFVKMIAVLAGLEIGEADTTFVDCGADKWYSVYVVAGVKAGFINGISETEFAPDDTITREQIATIMFRYAQSKGMNAITLEENLHFADANDISEYAVSAMNWAVGSGLMNGKTVDTLNPKDNATRAEVVAILHRYIEANK